MKEYRYKAVDEQDQKNLIEELNKLGKRGFRAIYFQPYEVIGIDSHYIIMEKEIEVKDKKEN